MESISRDEYKKKLQDPLYRRWITLNYCPSRWVDQSWISTRMPGIDPRLLDRPSVQPWLRQQLELEGLNWDLFQIPLARLLFESSDVLRHLMAGLAAQCYEIRIKAIIEKQRRQQLFAYLPKQTIEYVDQTGPLLLLQQPPLFQAISKHIALWDPKSRKLVNLYAVGEFIIYKALLYCLKKGDVPYQREDIQRWQRCYRLKFPYDNFRAAPSLFADLTVSANNQVVTLIMKLLRHLEPECAHLLQ